MFRKATISLRPETAGDLDFLRDLYLSVRDDDPGFRDLPPAERTQLLEHQFGIQHRQYREHFPGAWFTLVLVDEKPGGRLYVTRQADGFRVIDLSLLPEFRGHGIGTQLMKNIQAEATRTQLPIRLQVVVDNPARRFYARLGFRETGQTDVRCQLEWRPPRPPGRSGAFQAP